MTLATTLDFAAIPKSLLFWSLLKTQRYINKHSETEDQSVLRFCGLSAASRKYSFSLRISLMKAHSIPESSQQK